MGQGTTNGPLLTPLGKAGQMFTDLDARCTGRGWIEIATDFSRSIWLQVKAFMLGQTTRQENIDTGLGFASTGQRVSAGCLELREVITAHAEQSNRPGLDGGAAREFRVRPVLGSHATFLALNLHEFAMPIVNIVAVPVKHEQDHSVVF
jgi:hypothetical protein